MISRIRNSSFVKFLWGLMAIYLLNISVDSADPNPEHIPEDLSFNDQESIVEIVAEQILGYEDAFEEYDDHDTEGHQKKKSVKIDLTVHLNMLPKYSNPDFILGKPGFPDYEGYLSRGFYEIDGPPPKV